MKPPLQPNRLETDPDARMVRWGWLIWGATLIGLGLALRQGLHPGAFPPLAVPAALLLLWPGWRLGGWLWHQSRVQVHGPWQGVTFAFADTRIRVLDDETHGLLFVADDVLDLFDLRGRDREPARVKLMTGADGLVTASAIPLLCFTAAGLDGWLARRTDRRALAFKRWVEVEVMAPHQRARERDALGASRQSREPT